MFDGYAILNIPTDPGMSYDTIVTEKSMKMTVDHPVMVQLGGIAQESRWSDVLCDELKFHIANMSGYIGAIITYGPDRTSGYARRISLSDDEWETTIDGVKNIKELIEGLRQEGGFAITHAGVLRRKGKMPFKITEGLKQMKTLGFFLSFVVGRWCCPVLLVGMWNGEIVFRDLSGNTRIDPWKGNWSWSPKVAKYLDDAYKGFISKWKDPKLRGPIAKIIELYVRANTYPTVDLSVLDSFTALDCLASAYDPQIDKLWGSDRILSVISKGGLTGRGPPIALYTLYDTFYKTYCPAGSSKTADGATILTDFRNGVVHGNKPIKSGDKNPRPKLDDDGDISNLPVPFDIRIEAGELGLWYVELSLLCLFGYNGRYNDRLTRVQDTQSPPCSA